MLITDIPAKFNIPFANGAGGSFIRPIPQASQIGINPGFASLTDGFPPLNFTPIASGGIPPYGQDMNGILNQTTAWVRWITAGGSIFFDPTFSAAVGGYPSGGLIQSRTSPGNYYYNTNDNNLTDPDSTSSAGWAPFGTPIGAVNWFPTSAALFGWIVCNGTTIGNVGSGASQLASSTALLAYRFLWNGFSNTQCPVSGGRGANADADFTALKTIGTLNMQAIGVMGVDGMGGTPTGFLASVPVQFGAVTIPGSIVGENLHTLITSEMAIHSHPNFLTDGSHSHTYTSPTTNVAGTPNTTIFGTITTASTSSNNSNITITNANAGGGGSHNNTQRSMLGYWRMKA